MVRKSSFVDLNEYSHWFNRFAATNPNNWHWIEKNATNWSKEKLNELLVGLKIENAEWSCEIKEIKKCQGEASANNRKAKLVFLVSSTRKFEFD